MVRVREERGKEPVKIRVDTFIANKQMADTPVTYGTYNTPLTTIQHSALPNWSGYGYQGQCAMLHAVKLLLEDRERVKGYYLSLESYEDFVILDENEQIVSLHQCKCYSAPEDFTDECQKMSDKRQYYSNKLGKCAADVPCYFLSNITPSKPLICNVKAYEFQAGISTCDAGKVLELIVSNLTAYMAKYNCQRSEQTKASVLTSIVEDNVFQMHQKKNEGGQSFWQIATAKNNWIPFTNIISAIENPDDAIKSEALRAMAARSAINTHVTKCLNDDRNETDFAKKEELVNKFLNGLNSMDANTLISVVRRLYPHVEWNENNTAEFRGSEKGENLYRLLTSTEELHDYDKLSWNEDGILETPSTLGQSRSSVHFAERIRKNPVLAFLCDYRWIVGHIDNSIDNIMESAPNVTDPVTTDEPERITRPSTLGLLSVNDKNDPDYVKNHS